MCDSPLSRLPAKRMRKLIARLRTFGVDMYLAGHDHHLEVVRGLTLATMAALGVNSEEIVAAVVSDEWMTVPGNSCLCSSQAPQSAQP